ncbi:uncharacterized protein DFL_000290 [Arthrobotrys flagrans]|uniref:Uncharacterized protein n=1 Tax=Arthrobotrys flagrans TaxID=97331 RepID=A0A437ADH9_ARTFL|nr:hypothetical protein DFL_000290 [Arthrobotrys flagrans]
MLGISKTGARIRKAGSSILSLLHEDVSSGHRDVTSEPRYVPSESRNVTSEPQHVPSEPRDAISEPREAVPEPRATAEDTSLFQHSDWYDRQDEDLDLNFAGAKADHWKQWTARLEFTQQGHNLISDKGEMVQDMAIWDTNKDTAELITPEHMFICEEYKNKPGQESKVHDYGVILLPGNPKGGFGFSLKMAEAQNSNMRLPAVNVIGYHPNINEPEFYSGRTLNGIDSIIVL